MSLVTRCPACGTMFKVVADQLRVSQGWVRCGSCSEVFDATAHFQSAPPPAAADEAPVVGGGSALLAFADAAFESQPAVVTEQPMVNLTCGETVFEPTLQTDSIEGVVRLSSTEALGSKANAVGACESEAHSIVIADVLPDYREMSFVRKAQRRALWHRPSVQAAMVASAAGLVVLLGSQWIFQNRDQIAVFEPRSVVLLQALCQTFNCRIKPLRRIESLVIDSANFTKLDSKSFRLGFVLKNTADAPLETPLLEVTLSDSQDKTVLRRVLSPAQFGFREGELLAGRSETSGLVNLAVLSDGSVGNPVSAAMVAGYRVLVFYP